MAAQEINVGTTLGKATILKHFGYMAPSGVQTDVVLVDHSEDSNHIYQFQGGKGNDLTGRIPAGKSAAQAYDECLAAVTGKAELEIFVG